MKDKSVIKKSVKLSVSSIPIFFPFKPYKCQEEYMAKVIQSLNNNKNALLESPTGTGKTLSLLCATLAWVKNQRETLMPHASVPNYLAHIP
jgi:regulator of telomere elongation helicase 1